MSQDIIDLTKVPAHAMRGDGTAIAGQTGSSGNHPYSDDPNNPAPLHDRRHVQQCGSAED